MRLDEDTCWERLGSSGHGVLGTVHPSRGVDAVPVVFVVEGREVVIPIDAVKAKRGGRLQRLVNVDLDDRGVLLVEHYDDDWSRLWWVRLHGRAAEGDPEPHLARLAAAFPAYAAPGTVTSALLLRVDTLTGWAADLGPG